MSAKSTPIFGLTAARVALSAGIILTAMLAAGRVMASPPGDIVLGDIVVFRLRTPSGGLTPEERADKVQQRVNLFLAIPNLKAKDVVVKPTKYGPTIYVHNIKIITVDADDAKQAGVTPDALAKTWAHRLMGIVDQVDIRVPPPAPKAPAGTTPPDNGTTPGTPAPTNPPTAPPANPPAPGDKPATPPANPPATPPAPEKPADKPNPPAAPAAPTAPAPAAPATLTPPAPSGNGKP